SKPEIPPAPVAARAAAHAPEQDEDVELDKAASVGALAGVADDEAIEVDNTEPAHEAGGAGGAGVAAGAAAAKKGKKGKNAAAKKKFKIPNFEKFRSKLFLGIAAILILIVGYILAFMVLPKATVALKTDTSNLDTNVTVIADPNAQPMDTANG